VFSLAHYRGATVLRGGLGGLLDAESVGGLCVADFCHLEKMAAETL
jgi:hypothetical protein